MGTEEWKNIKDFPNYIVSNYGKIKNIKTGKIIKGSFQISNILIQIQIDKERKKKEKFCGKGNNCMIEIRPNIIQVKHVRGVEI